MIWRIYIYPENSSRLTEYNRVDEMGNGLNHSLSPV